MGKRTVIRIKIILKWPITSNILESDYLAADPPKPFENCFHQHH